MPVARAVGNLLFELARAGGAAMRSFRGVLQGPGLCIFSAASWTAKVTIPDGVSAGVAPLGRCYHCLRGALARSRKLYV